MEKVLDSFGFLLSSSYLCTLDMELIKKIANGIKSQATWLLVHILAALVAVYFRFSKDKEL